MRRDICVLVATLTPMLTSASEGPRSISRSYTPFEWTSDRHMAASATFNGDGPHRVLIDTGSSHSVVTVSLAKTLDLAPASRTVVVTPTGEDVRTVVSLDELTLGPLTARHLRPTVVPDGALDSAGRVKALIGQDVLRSRCYAIDLLASRIEWECLATTTRDRRLQFALSFSDDRPIVELPQKHATLRLVPDSGTTRVVLFRRSSDRGRAQFLSLPELRLGHYTLFNLPAVTIERPEDDCDVDGLLPLALFARVAFDPMAGVMTAWPKTP